MKNWGPRAIYGDRALTCGAKPMPMFSDFVQNRSSNEGQAAEALGSSRSPANPLFSFFYMDRWGF